MKGAQLMATVSKRNLKQILANRDEILNDNSESTISLDLNADNLESEEIEQETTPGTKKDQDIELQTPTRTAEPKKERNAHITRIERPKREILVATRITKEEYNSIYQKANECGCKSISDYIYYLITKKDK